MKKIAFITSEEDPNLIQDDQLVISPLEQFGFQVLPLIWDHPSQQLESFDAFIFRSCWNYHRKYVKFVHWINSLNSVGMPILNPVDISLWNLDKKYLLELEQKGALIPKTHCISKKAPLNDQQLKSILNEINASHVVIKPTVSLNGNDTYLLRSNDFQAVRDTIKNLPAEHNILIQEFIQV